MKKYKNLKIRITILIIVLPLLLSSQDIINPSSIKGENQIIKVIAKYDDNGVVLRWGTAKAGAWLMGTQYGYNISRGEFEIKGDTAKLIKYTNLTKEPVLPWSIEKIKAEFDKDTTNKYLLIALETIHDKYRTPQDGSFIAKSDELNNRFGFNLFASDMDATTSYASGLAYLDNTIEPNKDYMYRITMEVPDGVYPVDTAYIWINSGYKYKKSKPILSQGTEGEKNVVINLDREKNNKLFSAYFIERSTDSLHFTVLNKLPFVHGISEDSTLYSPLISYRDSVQNYVPYYYRVVGITPFGDRGLYSDVVKLMGRDKTPAGTASNVKAKYFEEQGMKVTWDFDGDYKDLAGYNVKYSQEFIGPYTTLNDSLLKKDEYAFYDPDAKKLEKNFYIVETVDTAGNLASSLQAYGEVLDSIPPGIPNGFVGTIDSTGVVTLNWNKNPEEDVIGYQVYFANDSNNVFAQITSGPYDALSIIDTVSIKTLTRHVYYRITAVDFKFNISPFSKIIELERPDIIPPNSPVFTDYKITKEGCDLSWASSTSNDIDYQVLSRKKDNDDWNEILKCDTKTTDYRDTTILPNTQYQYCIVAVDKSGLISDTINILNVKSPDFKIKKSVDSLSYKIDNKSVILNWDTKYNNIYASQLFRRSNNKPYQRIATIGSDKKEFEDRDIKPKIEYSYMIKIIFSDGEESNFSDEIKVILE